MVENNKIAKNTLSLSEYAQQKTNKVDSEQIAIALCNATKRAWENCHFSESEIPNVIPGKMPSLEGQSVSFQLHTEVTRDSNDSSYGTVSSITNNGTYESIDIDEVEQYKVVHNQDWNVVSKYYFKHLKEYLDLRYIELFNMHYKPSNKVVKDSEDFQPSYIYPPSAYEGSEPTIAISLVFSTIKQLNSYSSKKKELESKKVTD